MLFFQYVTHIEKLNESKLFIPGEPDSHGLYAVPSFKHYKGNFRLFQSKEKGNTETYSLRE